MMFDPQCRKDIAKKNKLLPLTVLILVSALLAGCVSGVESPTDGTSGTGGDPSTGATTPSDAAIEVSAVSIETTPAKTDYYVGETLDSSGLALKITYTDGTTETVTSGFHCAPTSLDTESDAFQITVTYGDYTTSFDVCVVKGEITWSLSNGTLTISGNGPMADYLSAPDADWRPQKSEIKKVIIESGVTSIGDYAFGYCDSLTSITIPDSVTKIGAMAFYSCKSLTGITIPENVTSIGSNAFSYCNSLANITLPGKVTSIGEAAFNDCNSFTSITIPGSVTSIGEDAFLRCNSLASITVSDDNAYYASVDGVLFDKDLKTLIQYPIGNTRSSYVIPSSVTSIADTAFFTCKALTSITIPDSVTEIGAQTFSHCDSLTSITIPGSVTRIDSSTFQSCVSLASVTISDSVTEIGSDAFNYCLSLTSVTYSGTKAQWDTVEKGNGWNSKSPFTVVNCADGDAAV